MAELPTDLFLAVHPHQLEVQEFESYDLVIDARPEREYLDDHVPGAISLPAARISADRLVDDSDERWQPAPTPTAESWSELPPALASHLARMTAEDVFLVYCSNGGLDSAVCAAPLRQAGFRVDVLPGGWASYRRWVEAGLESLPRGLTFNRIQAPPLSGVDMVLAALQLRGEQVLDLTLAAGQKMLPGIDWLHETAPSQGAFESALLDALRRFDNERVVWVGDCLMSLGGLQLPPALRDSLRRAGGVQLVVPIGQRALAWQSTLRQSDMSLDSLLESLAAFNAKPRASLLSSCRRQLASGKVAAALTAILERYVDIHYVAIGAPEVESARALDSFDPEAVDAWVDGMLSSDGSRSSPATP